MNQFYVYALCYEDGTPFYIGKGHGKRCYKHTANSGHNAVVRGILKKLGTSALIKKLVVAESEEWAFRWERFYICEFGRKDIGTGLLANHTNGGEGILGLIHTPETRAKMKGRVVSPSTRELLRRISTGNKYRLGTKQPATTILKLLGNKNAVGAVRSPEYLAGLRTRALGNKYSVGAVRSPEFREAASVREKGTPKSAQTIANMSASRLRWYAERRLA